MQPEHVAVIDLGTNTFHLLIVEITDADTYIIKEKYRETVKLGAEGMENHKLSPAAFERGLEALRRFRDILDHRGEIRAILANATSAIRSATNGAEFVKAAMREANIPIKVINGNEEAMLIYKGVRSAVMLPTHEDVLLVDIGGGSVEFVVGNRHGIKLLRSLNIGAARALEKIKPSDPMTEAEIRAAEQYFAQACKGLFAELKEFNLKTLYGSSGSFETLATLIAFQNGDRIAAENLNGFRFDIRKFRKIHKQLMASTQTQRAAMEGMDPMRVEMIMMGSILISIIEQELKLQDVVVSTAALKEGILCDYMETSRDMPSGGSERSLREKSVKHLMRKFDVSFEHAKQVHKFALSLFDQTQSMHGFGQEERELLGYAALLHDVGHYINRSGHHKHGQYIVQNSAMPGFSSNELLLISNLVRYHRKSLPSMEHFHFQLLYKEHKTMVNKLSSLLRLADCLDRGRRRLITDIRLIAQPRVMVLDVRAGVPVDIELDAAREAAKHFETAFDCRLEVVQNA
jgi:exopolyphosphatase/guanosine-5'-triphosphate,3'-diphosphate pyrophosphatase